MTDGIDDAYVKTRALAAARLVRKEELEGELKKLRAKREEAAALAAAAPAELAADAAAILAELDAKIDTKEGEVALAASHLASAVAEMDDLKKLARSAPAATARATVAALTEKDPLIQSDAERALENVRGHARELDAEVRTNDELGALENPDALSAASTLPVEPAPKAQTKGESDADALREFQERRARLTGDGKPPKKTM